MDIVKAKISIVDLLHVAKECKASQLEAFCLHFLCVNNQVYRKREDWESLTKEELSYIEENQWPPRSYFQDLEKYEEEVAKRKGGKGKGEKEGEKEECIIC